MLISTAYAAAEETSENLEALADAPNPTDAFLVNMGLVAVLVMLFYVLLIMPQQRRFREHSSMLSDLKKGDKVVTGGGLVGKIDKIINEKEVIVDLGNGLKVTALRSTIQGKVDDIVKPANDLEKPKEKPKKS